MAFQLRKQGEKKAKRIESDSDDMGLVPRGTPVPVAPSGVLTNDIPSYRENLTGVVASGAGALGASTPRAGELGRNVSGLLDWSPLSVLLAKDDAARAQSVPEAAVAALGAIPMVGGGARKAAKGVELGLKGLTRGPSLIPSKSAEKVVTAAKKASQEASRMFDESGKKIAKSTLGDLKRPDVTHQGKQVIDWTPEDFGAYGRGFGVDDLGPETNQAWEASLAPFKNKNGDEFHISGGLDSKDRLTYYDQLHLKAQGINPNELDPLDRMKLHQRLADALEAPGGPTEMQKLNQLMFGMISPNQPLTPNELAMASAMVKTPEDLDRLANESFFATAGNRPMSRVEKVDRNERSAKIASMLGVQAKGKGGTGHSGSADYSRIADMAYMYRENPDWFRFRGADEGGKTSAEQWANHVERVTSAVPGLSAKTGSLASVFEAPSTANISAVDRHMLRKGYKDMFETPAEKVAWENKLIAKFNKEKGKSVKTIEQMRANGGTDMFNDAAFSYLNKHPNPKMRDKKGNWSKAIPEHLQKTDWPLGREPEKAKLISKPYKRVLGAQTQPALDAGDSGVFSHQWRIWDEIRNRLEPHEGLRPGLEKLDRMSHKQILDSTAAHKQAGYMSNVEKTVDPVTGETSSSMKPVRRVDNPSSLAYWSLPAAVGGAGLMAGGGGEAEAAPAAPVQRLDQMVQEQAAQTGESPLEVLKRIFGL